MESRRHQKLLPPPDADAFSQADTNQDGKLSRDEASDFLVIEIFISRDANHDGRMTLEEWIGGDPTRSADFKKRDANDDGIVTMKEAITYGRAHGVVNQIMQEADTNHDGALSRAEVTGLLREPRRPGEVAGRATVSVTCLTPSLRTGRRPDAVARAARGDLRKAPRPRSVPRGA